MDIDVTFFVQLGIFLFLLVVLSNAVIRPLMQVLEARHERIVGGKLEVERLIKLADENRSAYQARIQEARQAARREREGLRAAGNEEKRRILTEVRGELTQKLSEARVQIQIAEDAAQKELAVDAGALAKDLIAKMLGREARP